MVECFRIPFAASFYFRSECNRIVSIRTKQFNEALFCLYTE